MKVESLVIQFNDALNAHDVDAMMAFMSEDCVFENTYPPPDGERLVGKPVVRAFWERFFGESRGATITVEEIFACGDRCVMRWVYRWRDVNDQPGHIRGVDVFRVRDDLIVEKLSYVKG